MQRALWLMLLVAGCKQADGLVVLTVGASPVLSGVTLLHVEASAGGRNVTFDDHPASPFSLPPERTLGIQFPSSVAGTMKLHVEAHGANNALLASGDATIDAHAGKTSDVTITLGAGGSPDLAGGDDGGDGGVGCVAGDGVCGAACNSTNDSDCAPVCGNGILEAGEVCDDHNSDNGDGCDPTCQFTNTVSIIAGTPSGQGYADGPGSTARLVQPNGVTTDQTYIYFGDHCSVRRYDPATKTVTTIAGTTGNCLSSTDGVGSAAIFTQISDLEFVPNGGKGVLYIGGDPALRKLDLATNGVTSVAGVPGVDNGSRGDGLGSSSDGSTLYLVDVANGLRSLNIAGGGSTQIATLAQLGNARCFDVVMSGGAYYLACSDAILKVVAGTPAPTVTTYAGAANVAGCTPSNSTLTAARFQNVNNLIVDASGDITATDSVCDVVWSITPGANGATVVVAGTPGSAGHSDTPSKLNGPTGVTLFGGDQYFVVDSGNQMLRSYNAFSTSTVAGVFSPGLAQGTADLTVPTFVTPFFISANGDSPIIAEAFATNALSFTLDITKGTATQFNSATVVGTVLGGNLYGAVYGSTDQTIWAYPLDGSAPSHYAGAVNSGSTVMDGSFTTALLRPGQFANDGANLYFTDNSHTIRKVDIKNQQIVTLAGTVDSSDVVDGIGSAAHFGVPTTIACDGANLYVLDGISKPGTIVRKIVIATGAVTTLAGTADMTGAVDGIGAAARFAGGFSLATDGHAVYVTDPGGGASAGTGQVGGPGSNTIGDLNGPTVRELDLATQRVTTMVGTRGQWTARPGVGTQAVMNQPYGIAFDAISHVLLVTDIAENVVYKIK
jgi:cysteine-rich repeat protein